MIPPNVDIRTLSREELLKIHAATIAEYSTARSQIDGAEAMPWIQADLHQLNQELERRGAAGGSPHA